jgi:asparagine synthase (glutamine-hydrolysing)
MCGIAGMVRFDGAAVAREDLARMSDAQRHRGPDGDGLWTEGAVGFGHRRLAIIDLSSAGSQPMKGPQGDIIIYNGEVYNFRELRRELEALGHEFVSTSDTEVVLHAWTEWQEASLLRLNGHFAFAIWNPVQRRMVLVRDRFGVKPLYYHDGGSFVAFASEVKALLALPAVPRRLCLPALNEYFTFQNLFTDRTLFDGIRLLPAGHVMELSPSRSGPARPVPFCDLLPSADPLDIDADEAAEEVHRLFVAAVERQLVSDVPVGTYLSGGLDSGSITTIARSCIGRLTTFTGGFDLSSVSGLELGCDERKAAEVLANWLKTEHYQVVLHAGDMEAVLPALTRSLEDLRVGQSYPNYYVARLASKFVKVVLSGAGGDELFAGYPWRYRHAAGATNRADFERRYAAFWSILLPDAARPAFFGDALAGVARDFSAVDAVAGVMAGSAAESPLDLALTFEARTYLQGLFIVEDKLSMAHSLESRVPFLDNDLVDFACAIPAHHKVSAGASKLVLRKAMRGLIPDHILNARKQGFTPPEDAWYRGPALPYLRQVILSPRGLERGHFRPEALETVFAEHVAGARNHKKLLWSLLCFEWWNRVFVDGERPERLK